VSVKFWVAFGFTPLVAVKVNLYVPWVPAAGVPDNTPVAALKMTPLGKDPDSERVGVGNPVEVTVKVLEWPTLKVVEGVLVMAGA
jgi:hypothetical protein